jgi:hypothetical protein
MAGSTESGLAGALEAQAKTLATQAKLLQQICDRLDAQDRHWESLERSVATNARSIASLSTTIGGLEAATVQSDAAKALSMQIESRLSDMTSSTWQRIDAVDATLFARVVALESATATLEAWRPGVERSVGAVHASMEGLRLDVARLADRLDQGPRASTPLRPSILGPYATTGGRPPAPTFNVEGPRGHRTEPYRREGGHGYAYTQGPLPNNGMFDGPPPPFVPMVQSFPPDGFGDNTRDQFVHGLGNLPKVPFPGFDGDNPKLWQRRCHDYFTMYSVDPRVWIKISTMHFTGAAARWLQSVECQLSRISWVEFGHMVVDRFGKDQHAVLIRQLFHIQQTTTVTDYAERFTQLIDQLHAYSPHADPLYYTMRFMDGLREDVRSVVMVQRPRDLDTAMVLAQLQEEVGDKRRDSKKYDGSYPSKIYPKSPLPLPPPPKTSQQSKPDNASNIGVSKMGSTDDKLASLIAYRRRKDCATSVVFLIYGVTGALIMCSFMWLKSCGKCCKGK